MPEQLTTGQKLKAFEYIEKTEPLLAKDALKLVEKIEPHYRYLRTCERIFKTFLERRNITEEQIQGVNISRQAIHERTLCIAVILWLYSPSIYNPNADFNVENGIRNELEGMLLCNEHWISQQVKNISFQYRTNYQEFKDQVNGLLDYIKENVKEKQVIAEEVKPELTMFG